MCGVLRVLFILFTTKRRRNKWKKGNRRVPKFINERNVLRESIDDELHEKEKCKQKCVFDCDSPPIFDSDNDDCDDFWFEFVEVLNALNRIRSKNNIFYCLYQWKECV